MNTTEKQLEKPSIINLLEGIDNRISHLSELTYGLTRKGHQLRDTSQPTSVEGETVVETPYSIEEILIIQSDRLFNLNQQLQELLNKLEGLF